jgi:hypothetical protein
MKPMVLAGVVLVALGVLALVFKAFSFTHKEKVADLGPVEISADKQESIPVAPVVGAIAIVGGIALIGVGLSRRA